MSAPDPYYQQPAPPSDPYYQQQQPYQPGVEINGKAVAALVCGILFVTSPLGIMGLAFGKTAERQINAGMGIGRPLAKAGRVLGWVSVGFTIIWALYFLVVIIILIGTANAASSL